MDPNYIQYMAYMNYLQNQSPTGDNSQNLQYMAYMNYLQNQPPTGDNSQNPQHFKYPSPQPSNPTMWFRPPMGTSGVVESPNNEPESPIGSLPESQVPQFSTQAGLENITLNEEEECPTKKNKRFRFLNAEDALLIQTWLNISKDPIVGVDQKADSFWTRIRDNYNNYRRRLIERETGPLKSRWHKINGCVQKFCGCYKTAVANNTSGKSDNNVMEAAYKLYSQTSKGSFKFEHAWRLLRDEPKWKGESMDNSSKISKTGAGTQSSSSNLDTPRSYEEYDSSITTDRPIGQKAAKRKGKETANPVVDLPAMEAVVSVKNITMTKIAEAKLAESEAIMASSKAKEAECKVKETESIPALYEILMKDVSAMDEAHCENHYLVCQIIRNKLALMGVML